MILEDIRSVCYCIVRGSTRVNQDPKAKVKRGGGLIIYAKKN